LATVIVNNPVGSNVIYKGQYTSVWVKAYWGSVWRYVPYLHPENSIEACAPSDSEAALTWIYGKYVNLWAEPGRTLLPITLENYHIQILVHTRYGTYIAWVGEAVGETLIERGIDVATGYPRGQQTIECRGLEYLLERRVVAGTYVGNRTSCVYLPVTKTFNDTSSRRESLAGNRSAEVNEVSGTYLFSSDGNKWSNFNIIQYLLAAFQPWYRFESVPGTVDWAPQFYLRGQTDALKEIFEEHRFQGSTLRECLNRLIDRKRGLGWYIRTNGTGPIYIVVYSLSQFPIIGINESLPANPRQIDLRIHDDKFIQAEYSIASTSQVDQIVVEGAPIKTCATIRFGNGTLEPAWEPDLDAEFALSATETAFKTLADEIYTNWDDVHTLTYFPLIQFSEFSAYSNVSPANFAFLFVGSTDPIAALLAGFNVLDADGDGALSKQDLLLFTPNDTYQAASEEMRATDKYATVFSHFQVPKTWNWTGWAPAVKSNGTVDLNGDGTYWNYDRTFERYLPFMEPGSLLGTEREYLEPFALVERPQRMRDILNSLAEDGMAPYNLAGAQGVDETITEAEFDLIANELGTISWTELEAGFVTYPSIYVQLDRAQQLDYPACSLRMGDSGLRIVVKSEANHVFALNHTEGGSYSKSPRFDYRTLMATVFFETDMMARVVLKVWNNVYQDADGNLVYQSSPIGKQIYIGVRGKEVWVVAPGTVTGLNGSDLVFFQDGAAGFARDDTPDLYFIAQLARVWYGQQRASLTMRIANQLPFFRPGDFIRSTISGRSAERVGTCVTAIRRNYQAGTHEVSTGYGELDPEAFGSKFR
jgi:hypothetical protein